MPRIIAPPGGGGKKKPPRQPVAPPPPPSLPPPPGFLASRASQIHLPLVQQYPDLGFSLLRSGILTGSLAAVSKGIWDYIQKGMVPPLTPPPPTEAVPLSAPPPTPGTPVFSQTTPSNTFKRLAAQHLGFGPAKPAKTPEDQQRINALASQMADDAHRPVAVIPSMQEARLADLPPQVRPVGQWLLGELAQSHGGVGFRRVATLRNNDPHDLTNLVLYTKQVGDQQLVVLRSSVNDMLQTGVGTPASVTKTPTGRGGYTVTRNPAVAANPNDPNFLRAQAIIAIVHKVLPNARIEFQSGGLVGSAFTQITGLENAVAPVEGIGAGSAILPQVRDALKARPGVETPTPSDQWAQSLTSTNLQFGKEVAENVGLKPTDPGYGAFTGGVNFISDWYLNPLIVGGKIAEGVRLASRVPKELGSARGFAGVVYRAGANSIEDLVTKTSKGTETVNSVFRTIIDNPRSAADALVKTHGFTPRQAAIMATSRDPVEVADNLINHFRGLSEPDVKALMGRQSEVKDQITQLQKMRDEAPARGTTMQTDALGDRIAQLVAENDTIEAKLRFNPASDTFDPLRELPVMRKSNALMQGAADAFKDVTGAKRLNAMGEWFERHILVPSDIQLIPGTRVNLRRIFTPIVKEGDPYRDPWGPHAERGDLEKFHEGWNAVMVDYGVPQDVASELLSRLIEAKNTDEGYRAVMHDIIPGIKEHSPMPKTFLDDNLKIFEDTFSDDQWMLDIKIGQTGMGHEKPDSDPLFYTHGSDEYGNPQLTPQPGLRAQLAKRWYLPSHEAALDITSAWRRLIRHVWIPGKLRVPPAIRAQIATLEDKIKAAPTAEVKNKLYADLEELKASGAAAKSRRVDLLPAWHAYLRMADRVTRLWKNAILLGRAPAVFIRTAGEESVRAAAAGVASIVNEPWRWISNMLDLRGREALLNIPGLSEDTKAAAAALNAERSTLNWYQLREKYRNWREFNREMAGDTAKALGSLHSGNLRDAIMEPQWGRKISFTSADMKERDAAWQALQATHAQLGQDEMFRKILMTQGNRDTQIEEMMKWARTPNGTEYINDVKNLWNKYTLSNRIDRIEQEADIARIGGVSEERLRTIFGKWSRYADQMTDSNPRLRQAILNHGIPDGGNKIVEQAFAQLQESRQLYQEYETLSTRAETIDDATAARLRAQRLEDDAKEVLNSVHVSSREVHRMMETGVVPKSDHWHHVGSGGYIDTLKGMADSGEWHPPTMISGKVWKDTQAAGLWERRAFSNWMYETFLSGPDIKFVRKPVFQDFFRKEMERLRGLGYEEDAARSIAGHHAAEQTRSLLYDLSERTSAQHFARHLAPFLPAWQEILTTWAWELPKRYYQVVGQAFLATRGHQLIQALSQLGVDPNKPQTFGPLGWIMNQAMGNMGPSYKATYNIKDFNLVAQSIMPGLGPIPEAVLSAFNKKFPIIGDLTTESKLTPYGLDITFGPLSLNRAWEGLFKRPPPWEVLSQDTQDTAYAFAKTDSIRHARVQLAEEGMKPPGENSTAEYARQYKQALIDKANHDLQWWFLYRAVATTFFPAPLHMTDSYKASISDFYKQIEGMAPGDPAADDAWRRWLEDHPYGDFYRTPSTVPTDQIPQSKYARYHDSYQKMQAEIKGNDRIVLNESDFIDLGNYLSARTIRDNQIQHAIDDIGTSAPALLSNWNKRSTVINNAMFRWGQFTTPDSRFGSGIGAKGEAIWNGVIRAEHPNDYQKYSDGLTAITQFYQAGKELMSMDTPNGISRADVHAVLGQMSAAISNMTDSPGSVGKYGKQFEWYFNTVYRPYATQLYDKKKGLYAQANKWKQLESPERPDAYVKFSLAMEKIREIKAAQERQTGPDGLKYPTPEQFQWGNMPEVSQGNEPSQEKQITDWLTLKPEWLTPFALKKIGLGGTPQQDRLSGFIANYDARLDTYISAHKVYPGSSEWDHLQAKRNTDLGKLAGQLGPSALRLWRSSNETPAERMVSTGWATPDSVFGMTTGFAGAISQQIAHAGYSPKGTSQLAVGLKRNFYLMLDQMYRTKPSFQADINQLQAVLGVDPDRPANRYAVYGAIYFDDRGGL